MFRSLTSSYSLILPYIYYNYRLFYPRYVCAPCPVNTVRSYIPNSRDPVLTRSAKTFGSSGDADLFSLLFSLFFDFSLTIRFRSTVSLKLQT